MAYVLIMTNYSDEEDEKSFKKTVYARLLIIFLRYNSNIVARQLIDIIQHRVSAKRSGDYYYFTSCKNIFSMPVAVLDHLVIGYY